MFPRLVLTLLVSGQAAFAQQKSKAEPEGPPTVPFMASTTENSFLTVDCARTEDPLEVDCRFTQVSITVPKPSDPTPWTKADWAKWGKTLCKPEFLASQRKQASAAASDAVKASRMRNVQRQVELCECKDVDCANAQKPAPSACTLSVNSFNWVMRKRGRGRWVFSGPGTGWCQVDFLVTLEQGASGWTFTQRRTADPTDNPMCSHVESTSTFTSDGQPGNQLDLSLACPSGEMRAWP